MSETHKVNDLSLFNIPGYKLFWNGSDLNKCDGCIVFVKNEIYVEHLVIVNEPVRVIRVSVQKDNMMVDILATYRTFAIDKNIFLASISDILNVMVMDQNRSYVFVGDVNINILESNSPNANDYLTLLYGLGFVSLINKPTRVSGTGASCIHHCFIKCRDEILNNLKSMILISDLTDHYPILVSLKKDNVNNKLVENSPPNKLIKHVNYDKINELISQEKWGNVLAETDVNLSTNTFINTMIGVIERATIYRQISSKKRRIKPWITNGLVVSIRKRDKLKKQCNTSRNDTELLNNYKAYRSLLSKLIKKAKYTYYKNLAQTNKNDPKKIWRVIREATNDSCREGSIECLVNNENNVLTSDADKANEFNIFFSSIGKTLAKKIMVNKYDGVDEIEAKPNTLFLTPIDNIEMIEHINSLKINAAGGDDNISAKIIKYNYQNMLIPLKHLANLIFGTGIYPDILKTATVIPIFKQGDKKQTNNYRPITLTSTVSKLIEKCIKKRLLAFLDKYKLIDANQFGFREGSNTEKAICKVTEDILKTLDQGKKVVAIFLDLMKAFDTVDHHILLRRLENIGVRGITNNLIRSYLSGRMQSVRLNDTKSDKRLVEYGVPQGTVLAPILFNIYINGLLSVLKEGNVYCFADDTVIIINDSDWDMVKTKSELAMFKVKKWLDNSLLSLNTDKTKFVAFSLMSRNLPTFQNITLHSYNCNLNDLCQCDQLIERTKNVKYLGIMMDENLSWKDHIMYITNKIRKLIYKFYELRNIFTFKMLKIIYQSLVESIICYGLVVWGSAGKMVLKKLEIAQKAILKIILFKKKRYPSILVYKDSQTLNPKQLYIKTILRFMLQNPNYRETLINHGKNTRGETKNNITLCNPRHTTCQNHIYYAGPKLFNMLPHNIRNKPYYKVKNEINNWILDTNFTII